jgi:hypothetical protein
MIAYRKIISEVDILRGIQKNGSFSLFAAQATMFSILNLNMKEPNQQTPMLEVSLSIEKKK